MHASLAVAKLRKVELVENWVWLSIFKRDETGTPAELLFISYS
jgi:hypothetical protein